MPPPFPKEVLDIRDVGATRDVLDRFVVDGEHRRADVVLAIHVGQVHLHLGLLPRLVFFGGREDFDIQDPLFRRNDELLRFRIDLSAADGHGLHEEVGHVLFDDRDLFNRALPFQPQELGSEIDAVGRTDEEQDGAVRPIRIELQTDFLTRVVFPLVGNQLDVVEAEICSVEALANDGEEVAPFNDMLLAVGELVGEAILPLLRRLDLLLRLSFFARVQIPLLNRRFDRLAVLVVADLEKRERALSLYGFVVEGLGLEARLNYVADAVIASVNPRENLEWLAGDENFARADDRPARFIADLG